MMLKLIRTRLSILIALFSLTAFAVSDSQIARAQSLNDAMPVDPQITIGKLPNGLRYYIRTNKKPEKRAELRLVIKTGSILEDDDQQGLAHFVEHMAFNGTRNFPKNEIISFMESLGMRFGADLNAYTSFDETVYTLSVPTDNPEKLARAFQILEDWAHNVTFDPAEIEKERGVVMEEWRLGRGANQRMLDRILPLILKGSRYGERLPIGKPEIIQKGKAERLKQFYSDWYRPDLMAVVAVGDFDRVAIEKMIKSHFTGIPAATKPRTRTDYDVSGNADTIYAIATDKEANASIVEVYTVLPARPEGSVGNYRQHTVDRLFSGMLTARFSEITQQPNAPLLFAGSGRGSFFARSKDSAVLSAVVKEDGIERALDVLLTEAERAARFGFTATELERQKQITLRSYERLAMEKDNQESADRAGEYVRNFLTNESLPSAEDEYALHKKFLPEITLAEVNKLASEWFPNRNRLVIIRAPEKAGLVVPDQAKLTNVEKAIASKELKPYVDSAGTAALLDTVPAPGTITKTVTREAVGITEWELSNGVRVILKPTIFKEDEILVRASSPGGTSLAADGDYLAASSATQLITAGGLGKFNLVDLRKLMSGKVAAVTPFISETQEGLSGSSSRKDLETMFQLIYLRFTQPRADTNAFAVLATQAKTLLANDHASPEAVFYNTLLSTLFQNHPRRRPLTPEMIDQWNLDKQMAFYRDRFADAADFTFVFVGNFDLATMKPLVERYLGSLPSIRRKETWKDVGARTAAEVVVKKVEKGVEPKSQTAIIFNGSFEFNQKNRIAIRAMSEILQRRLEEIIREELGGTYGVTATPSYERVPNPTYSILIEFGSAPDRAEALLKRVFEEIEALKTSGPTDQQLAAQKETLLREFEVNSKLNNYLVNQIAFRYESGDDPAAIWLIPDHYRKLDKATIQEAAKTYLNTKRYVKVILLPEKK